MNHFAVDLKDYKLRRLQLKKKTKTDLTVMATPLSKCTLKNL